MRNGYQIMLTPPPTKPHRPGFRKGVQKTLPSSPLLAENLPQKHSLCPEQQPAVTRLLPAHTLRDRSRATRPRLHARQPRASIISAEALFISADRLRCEAAQMLRWHSAGGLQDVSRVDNEQLGEEDADYVGVLLLGPGLFIKCLLSQNVQSTPHAVPACIPSHGPPHP